MFSYELKGVCAKRVDFDIVDNKLKSVSFVGGCAGNTAGVSSLIEGMDIDEVIKRLHGIDCKNKGTSCPDQLTKALEKALQDIQAKKIS